MSQSYLNLMNTVKVKSWIRLPYDLQRHSNPSTIHQIKETQPLYIQNQLTF